MCILKAQEESFLTLDQQNTYSGTWQIIWGSQFKFGGSNKMVEYSRMDLRHREHMESGGGLVTSHKVCIDFFRTYAPSQMLCTQIHTFVFFLSSSLMYLLSKLISRKQGWWRTCMCHDSCGVPSCWGESSRSSYLSGIWHVTMTTSPVDLGCYKGVGGVFFFFRFSLFLLLPIIDCCKSIDRMTTCENAVKKLDLRYQIFMSILYMSVCTEWYLHLATSCIFDRAFSIDV